MFFSVTKLYQSKDTHLRRMVYLVIKDVCPGSDEVCLRVSACTGAPAGPGIGPHHLHWRRDDEGEAPIYSALGGWKRCDKFFLVSFRSSSSPARS